MYVLLLEGTGTLNAAGLIIFMLVGSFADPPFVQEYLTSYKSEVFEFGTSSLPYIHTFEAYDYVFQF